MVDIRILQAYRSASKQSRGQPLPITPLAQSRAPQRGMIMPRDRGGGYRYRRVTWSGLSERQPGGGRSMSRDILWLWEVRRRDPRTSSGTELRRIQLDRRGESEGRTREDKRGREMRGDEHGHGHGYGRIHRTKMSTVRAVWWIEGRRIPVVFGQRRIWPSRDGVIVCHTEDQGKHVRSKRLK